MKLFFLSEEKQNGWMNGWLGFYGILNTHITDVTCQKNWSSSWL